MALKSPREILWKWHLSYLITKMRLETSERPSSWWLPWGHLLQLRDKPDNNAHLQGPASSATRQDIWQKNSPSPHVLPGPCPQCCQSGPWKDDCPSLFLQGRSVSHSHSQQSEGLTNLLGLAAEDRCSPVTLAHFKITSEETRITVQVVNKPQSPTWCYQTSQVSFIFHRSLWWGWTVSSTIQKGKTVLFKFRS
jgi:hypothetical protein